ncbi:ornithine cyclodeaminase [Micromonospora pattaloongensis]|uniref:Ornithine cyclodeaminase n=1 Tax=Micromonospora pattaloongensis TaxID=405436 RepID=A0A1H3KHN9_9ACTN|nr:NAD(P)-binding domain-containing protein [Micromonospora pattaloongensis]SDY51295.1 ornithine cyclodeaminase [Micromonospora pattaloongensis]
MPMLFTDDEVAARLDATTSVAAMRAAIVDAYEGRLVAPPRTAAPLTGGRLVMTAGQLTDRWYGYRSYDTFGHRQGEQLVVLHDAATGRVRAMAVGEEIGSRRTGAIGGVATAALAREESRTIGVIGAGGQAWTQLWAAAAVRPLREVTVFSRTPASREAFAARVRAELGLRARAVDTAAAAVAGRDIVVLATTSRTPVISATDLAPGTHVNAVGFKQHGRSEFGLDLVDRAHVLATDSPVQAVAYDPPMIVVGTTAEPRLRHLGAILAGALPGRTTADEITLFCSVGLAGTEAYLLDRLASSVAVPV